MEYKNFNLIILIILNFIQYKIADTELREKYIRPRFSDFTFKIYEMLIATKLGLSNLDEVNFNFFISAKKITTQ